MGLGESEAAFDKRSAIECSICLEIVAGGGKRSTARLPCGHEFHLDCIGSAFNAKGLMQCPNCREVEKGNWLYSNGITSSPDLSGNEWAYGEDLYELTFSEMSYELHWCPFARLARIPSSFETGSQIGGSFASSMFSPPYITGSQPHSHIRDNYNHRHRYPSGPQGPMYSNARRPAAPAPLPEHATSYYLFQPTPSSTRTFQEFDGEHFYMWDRDHHRFAPFPLLPVDNRESRGFRPYSHSAGSSNPSRRAGLRADASSYRPPHASRRRPHL